MANYLLLQKNSRAFLLVVYTDRFHIIAVNHKLDEEKEESVLAGNCSDAVIDEMGLTRETIMKSDLRGVALGGSCAGDAVILYAKAKKLKYVLSDDYSSEEIEAVFAGIQRFKPSINGSAKKTDWRRQMQDEAMQEPMEKIGCLLNFSGCAYLAVTMFVGRMRVLWSILCLAIMMVSLGLYLAYPQYFSIMGSKEYKRAGYTAKVKQLTLAIMAPALALSLQGMKYFYFPNWTPLLIAGAGLGITVAVVLYIRSREIKENTSMIIITLLLAMFVSCGIVAEVNHIANTAADEPQTCVVLDTERRDNGRHADRYYCTVSLEPGVEMDIPISGSVYYKLQSGDRVAIFAGRGALGIEYAYFAGMQY